MPFFVNGTKVPTNTFLLLSNTENDEMSDLMRSVPADEYSKLMNYISKKNKESGFVSLMGSLNPVDYKFTIENGKMKFIGGFIRGTGGMVQVID